MKTNFKIRITVLACMLFASSYLLSQTYVTPFYPLNSDDYETTLLDADEAPANVDLELVCVGADRYAVFAFADTNFVPPAYTVATAGRVTIVVPMGFSYTSLTSYAGGKWKPGAVYPNPPQDQGRMYLTFNLTPNSNQLGFDNTGDSIMLFSLRRMTGNVDTLYLMEDYTPQLLEKNLLSVKGTGFGIGPDIDYEYGQAYNRENWNCNPAAMVAPPNHIGGNVAAAAPGEWLRISPNPARGWVDVFFKTDVEDMNVNLRVLNLQGQLVSLISAVNGEKTRLQLDNLAPGLYFVVLESQGKVLHREKLVVE